MESISNKSSPSPLHDNADLDATALDPLVLLSLRLLDPHLLLRLVLLLLMVLLAVLLLATILHLLLLARISTRHRVRSRMMRLPILRMLRLMLLAVIESRHLRSAVPTSLPQIDVDPALILLGIVLQSQLATNLLDLGLDLLHVPDTVVPLAHNDVQMPLARLLRVSDALFEDFFRFLDELAVQVDGVRVYAAHGVVFAENVLGGLFV